MILYQLNNVHYRSIEFHYLFRIEINNIMQGLRPDVGFIKYEKEGCDGFIKLLKG
jgi:hypothetical protein